LVIRVIYHFCFGYIFPRKDTQIPTNNKVPNVPHTQVLHILKQFLQILKVEEQMSPSLSVLIDALWGNC